MVICMDIKKKIISLSKEVGIDLISFASANPAYELIDILKHREKNNYLSGFEEKDLEKRINPKMLMKDTKSIIVIGLSYFIEENHIESNRNKDNVYGKISRTSWGTDYHIILKEKMKRLMNLLVDCVGSIKYKCYVDTGPLVDRHLAYKSGIGWYGKNNCIITDKYGSFIFIGYILCDIDIEIDEIEEKKCKECYRCVKACPTGALMKENEYDAKKCISYLTQTKDDIDYALREKMGISIYGCDICQVVCPYNNDLKTRNKEFHPEGHIYNPNLFEILSLSNRQFKKKYGNSALGWRGNRIVKRNAIIALGNLKEKKSIEILKKYLDSDSIMLKKYAAWAILRIDKIKGKEILDGKLRKETDKEVIEEIKKLYRYYL